MDLKYINFKKNKMGFTTSISIGYKDLWDDFDQVNFIDFLAEIPTINSLEIVGYFNAQVHTLERDTTKQIDFLNMWLGRLPAEVNEKVSQFIERILLKGNTEFNFINNISSLKLIEQILKYHNSLEKLENLTPKQELDLFKAYLYCSQEWTDKQLLVLNGEEIDTPEKLIDIILPVQLPYQEILEFKDFRMQFIKAIYFFKFCETNAIFNVYLKIFLDFYKLEKWQDYLVNILSLYVRKFERLRTPSVINVSDEFLGIIHFLDYLSIDLAKFSISDDFLSLREKPVYKQDENNYVFLNLNFLVDKIFQGVQFDFAKVLIANKATYKGNVIKSFPDFKSAYGDEFSESGLFYQVLEYAFETIKCVKFRGSEMKEYLVDGEPDYYMRDKSKIYLFEYKDVLINAKTKHSYDISNIKDEISNKLIQNKHGSSKGITQLVNVIEKIKANEFKKFDDYDYGNVTIYPILVYTDFSFNLSGVNYYLNAEFRKIINSRGIQNSHLIKDLVLIDLDTLIKFQDLFRDERLKLNTCFADFYNLLKTSKNIFDRISTFDMFIHNKTWNIPYDSPKMFMEEIKGII